MKLLSLLFNLVIIFNIISFITPTASSTVFAQGALCAVTVEPLEDGLYLIGVTADPTDNTMVSVIIPMPPGGNNVEPISDETKYGTRHNSPGTDIKLSNGTTVTFENDTTTRFFVTTYAPVGDISNYMLIVEYPTASDVNASCDGATDLTSGSTTVDLGGNETAGPSEYCFNHTSPIIYNSKACQDIRDREEELPPVPAPIRPVDPCEGKTGSDKVSCEARVKCESEESRKQGKVFARAFNNACVTLPEFIQTVINYVMMFAAIIAGFLFLQGGIKIVASRGNPTALVEARSTLINAGVGLILIAISYVIIQFLSDAFAYGVSTDINLLGPFIP